MYLGNLDARRPNTTHAGVAHSTATYARAPLTQVRCTQSKLRETKQATPKTEGILFFGLNLKFFSKLCYHTDFIIDVSRACESRACGAVACPST